MNVSNQYGDIENRCKEANDVTIALTRWSMEPDDRILREAFPPIDGDELPNADKAAIFREVFRRGLEIPTSTHVKDQGKLSLGGRAGRIATLFLQLALLTLLLVIWGEVVQGTTSFRKITIAAGSEVLKLILWCWPILLLALTMGRYSALQVRDKTSRCGRCGYVLRGLAELRCPECGERFD